MTNTAVDGLRVGVVGVGALGQHHARVYAALPDVRLTAVHDADPERARAVAEKHGARVARDLDELLTQVDALSVATPTVHHHELALRALRAGRHVLVEKPITSSLAEADDLIREASERRCVLQVGHIERFNPAAEALYRHGAQARFVEVHRLGSFSARSLDIDVVLDLMIHDLDIVLALDGSDPVQVEAVGVPVLTPKVDIANARLRFASGLIANLTASRVSMEKVRKFRVFAPATYVSVDFAAREAQVYRLEPGPAGPTIAVERSASPDDEPLRRQLASFVEAVQGGLVPRVSGLDGRRALALALKILERIQAGPGR
jgi:predicted dehydrogenase